MDYSHYKLFRRKYEYFYDIKNLSSSKVNCSDQTQSPQLNFDFTWKPTVRKWRYDTDQNCFIFFSDYYFQRITKCFQISEYSIIGNRETLMKDLKWMPMPNDRVDVAIMLAEEELQSFMQFSALFKHNLVCMHMEITHHFDLFYVPRDDTDLIMQLSIEDSVVPRMVPATDESIKSLERRRLFGGENCVICLEENLFGCEAISMPCEHVFHGNCIEEWLKTSHYCPVCRFKMPTS